LKQVKAFIPKMLVVPAKSDKFRIVGQPELTRKPQFVFQSIVVLEAGELESRIQEKPMSSGRYGRHVFETRGERWVG
jgi:hypothetical protein